jgi:large subunit ribosomal protein L16
MLQPKRVKFRKTHKGRRTGAAHDGAAIAFGEYALQALGSGWMTARQIESARRAITRSIRRGGKVWIRVFPDKPVTKKPAETRMGGGKGAPDHWVAVIHRGRILFELAGVDEGSAKEAMRLASYKLPFETRFLSKAAVINLEHKKEAVSVES